MVLEEATIPTGEDGVLPPGDADKYDAEGSTFDSSGPPISQTIKIDLTQLPRPVPIISPLIGFSNRRLVRSIISGHTATISIAKRPLTKEEADAVSYGIAQTYSTSSYGVLVGGMLGLARSYNTAPDFKFPMVKRSGMNVNFNEFGKWRGAQAHRGWHIVRGSLYLMIGSLLGHFVASTYAAGVEAKRFAEDPKLKNLVQTMIRNTQQAKAAGNAGIQSQASRHTFGSERGDNTAQEDPNNSAQATPDYSQPSPYDSTMGSYDEASPTRASPALGKSTADKSSWDRVRQQAMNGKTASSDGSSPNSYNRTTGSTGDDKWQRGRKDAQAGVDTFAFSNTDEDRQLAKAAAKKDFEAMLERERRGGNP